MKNPRSASPGKSPGGKNNSKRWENLKIGSRLEAMDFTGTWYGGKVVEIKESTREIMVHFDGWNDRFNQWFQYPSTKIRNIQSPACKEQELVKLRVGHRVLAPWKRMRFPAIITQLLNQDAVEVRFTDGVVGVVPRSQVKLSNKVQVRRKSTIARPFWRKDLKKDAKGSSPRTAPHVLGTSGSQSHKTGSKTPSRTSSVLSRSRSGSPRTTPLRARRPASHAGRTQSPLVLATPMSAAPLAQKSNPLTRDPVMSRTGHAPGPSPVASTRSGRLRKVLNYKAMLMMKTDTESPVTAGFTSATALPADESGSEEAVIGPTRRSRSAGVVSAVEKSRRSLVGPLDMQSSSSSKGERLKVFTPLSDSRTTGASRSLRLTPVRSKAVHPKGSLLRNSVRSEATSRRKSAIVSLRKMRHPTPSVVGECHSTNPSTVPGLGDEGPVGDALLVAESVRCDQDQSVGKKPSEQQDSQIESCIGMVSIPADLLALHPAKDCVRGSVDIGSESSRVGIDTDLQNHHPSSTPLSASVGCSGNSSVVVSSNLEAPTHRAPTKRSRSTHVSPVQGVTTEQRVVARVRNRKRVTVHGVSSLPTTGDSAAGSSPCEDSVASITDLDELPTMCSDVFTSSKSRACLLDTQEHHNHTVPSPCFSGSADSCLNMVPPQHPMDSGMYYPRAVFPQQVPQNYWAPQGTIPQDVAPMAVSSADRSPRAASNQHHIPTLPPPPWLQHRHSDYGPGGHTMRYPPSEHQVIYVPASMHSNLYHPSHLPDSGMGQDPRTRYACHAMGQQTYRSIAPRSFGVPSPYPPEGYINQAGGSSELQAIQYYQQRPMYLSQYEQAMPPVKVRRHQRRFPRPAGNGLFPQPPVDWSQPITRMLAGVPDQRVSQKQLEGPDPQPTSHPPQLLTCEGLVQHGPQPQVLLGPNQSLPPSACEGGRSVADCPIPSSTEGNTGTAPSFSMRLDPETTQVSATPEIDPARSSQWGQSSRRAHSAAGAPGTDPSAVSSSPTSDGQLLTEQKSDLPLTSGASLCQAVFDVIEINDDSSADSVAGRCPQHAPFQDNGAVVPCLPISSSAVNSFTPRTAPTVGSSLEQCPPGSLEAPVSPAPAQKEDEHSLVESTADSRSATGHTSVAGRRPLQKSPSLSAFKGVQNRLEEASVQRISCTYPGCGKLFRKAVILEKHVKYYHTQSSPGPNRPRTCTVLDSPRSTGVDPAPASSTVLPQCAPTENFTPSTPSSMQPQGTQVCTEAVMSTPCTIDILPRSTAGFSRRGSTIRLARAALSEPRQKQTQAATLFSPRGCTLDRTIRPAAVQQSHEQRSASSEYPSGSYSSDEDSLGEITKCICNYGEEDGFMIMCDNCKTWQHAVCMGISEGNPPELYLCHVCRNPKGLRPGMEVEKDLVYYLTHGLKKRSIHQLITDLSLEQRSALLCAYKLEEDLNMASIMWDRLLKAKLIRAHRDQSISDLEARLQSCTESVCIGMDEVLQRIDQAFPAE